MSFFSKVQNNRALMKLEKYELGRAGLAALLISFLFILGNVENAKKAFFDLAYTYQPELVSTQDVVYQDGNYQVIGDKACFVYKLPARADYMMASIKYTIVPSNERPDLKVYYADESKAFTKEKSFLLDSAGGRRSVFSLPNEMMAYIRIDVNAQEGCLFSVDSMKVAIGGIGTYLGLIFNWFNILVFVLLFAVCCLLTCLQKRGLGDFLKKYAKVCCGVLVCLAVVATIAWLFQDILSGEYIFSLTNVIYKESPSKTLGVATKGLTGSDMADNGLTKIFHLSTNGLDYAWSMYNMFGYPELNAQYLLSPFMWLLFGVTSFGQMARYILKYTIAMVGMYLFLRNIKCTKLAAGIGGVTYAFSSAMVLWGGWPHTDVGAMAPLLFYVANKFLDAYSAKSKKCICYLMALSLIVYVMLVAGMPTYAACFIYMGIIYEFYNMIFVHKFKFKQIMALIFMFGLALLLAGVMSFAYTGETFLSTQTYQEYRGQTPGYAFARLNRKYLLTFLLPELYISGGSGIEYTLFSGIFLLFLLPALLSVKGNKNKWFWVGAVAVLMFFICSKSAGKIYQFIPLINTSRKTRMIIVLNFGISILTAVAISGLMSEKWRLIKSCIVGSIWMFSAFLAFTVLYFTDQVGQCPHINTYVWCIILEMICLLSIVFPESRTFIGKLTADRPWVERLLRIILSGTLLVTAVTIMYMTGNKVISPWIDQLLLHKKITCCILAILIALLTLVFSNTKKIAGIGLLFAIMFSSATFAKRGLQLIDANASVIPPPTESIVYLQEVASGDYRMATIGKSNWVPNYNSYYGIYNIGVHGLESTHEKEIAFFERIEQDIYDIPTKTSLKEIENWNFLLYSGTRYLLVREKDLEKVDLSKVNYQLHTFSDGECVIELADAQGRAFVATDAVSCGTEEEILDRMAEVYRPNTIFATDLDSAVELTANAKRSNVQILGQDNRTISLKAVLDGSGYVVLNDFCNGNWQVYVNGIKRELKECNYLFNAVYLDSAGEYSIDLKYVNMQRRICWMVTGIGWAMFLAIFIARKKIGALIA